MEYGAQIPGLLYHPLPHRVRRDTRHPPGVNLNEEQDAEAEKQLVEVPTG